MRSLFSSRRNFKIVASLCKYKWEGELISLNKPSYDYSIRRRRI
jgi:hypothetical protein